MELLFLGLPFVATMIGATVALVTTKNKLDIEPDVLEPCELLDFVAREIGVSHYTLFESAHRADGRPHATHIDLAFHQYLKTGHVPTFVHAHTLTMYRHGVLEA